MVIVRKGFLKIIIVIILSIIAFNCFNNLKFTESNKLDSSSWIEYSNNPVFNPEKKAYYPSVVKISPIDYRMWYGSDSGIGYAISNDGLNWKEIQNPVNGLTSTANHPYIIYDENGFDGVEYKFRIWYWNGISYVESIEAIRTAISKDGINWENDQPIQQHSTNKSLQLIAGWGVYNNYFYHIYGPACVLYNSQGTNIGSSTLEDKADDNPMSYKYIMYYDTSSEGFSSEKSEEELALAYSIDGYFWIRYGDQPVLIPSGDSSEWDGKYITRGTVIKNNDGTYDLWYSGGVEDSNDGIGYAYSSDGINWVKSSNNPIFHQNDGVSWRNNRTYTPFVIKDGCGHKMWFSGRDSNDSTIGFAYTPCNLSGYKWNDINQDGIWNSEEPTIAGWEIYIDLNKNGSWNNDEPITLTGADGKFNFTNLIPDTYRIREVNQSGWNQTYPASGYHDVTFGSNQTNINFGNCQQNPSAIITKTPDNQTKYRGDNVTWTINVRNNGNVTLTNVYIKDTLPNGFTYIATNSITSTGARISIINPTSGSTGTIVWGIWNLDPDEYITIIFTA
ncbi:MAG TPA: SdrD B-like domain-containing protein, partial [Caldisericia bacterium]|nr:SdrD B-like domain-containing protein [Caldisericia bacterium]